MIETQRSARRTVYVAAGLPWKRSRADAGTVGWGKFRVQLIYEARLAFGTLRIELDFLWQRGKLHASEQELEEITKS